MARSSAAEHHLDTVGVVGSIPIAPTIDSKRARFFEKLALFHFCTPNVTTLRTATPTDRESLQTEPTLGSPDKETRQSRLPSIARNRF